MKFERVEVVVRRMAVGSVILQRVPPRDWREEMRDGNFYTVTPRGRLKLPRKKRGEKFIVRHTRTFQEVL